MKHAQHTMTVHLRVDENQFEWIDGQLAIDIPCIELEAVPFDRQFCDSLTRAVGASRAGVIVRELEDTFEKAMHLEALRNLIRTR